MWLCEGKLKVKIAYFRLPSASQKRAYLSSPIRRQKHKSQRARMHVQTLANEDTLLPTQMSPRLPACAKFVADTHFVSGTQQMFLILFRNILCPQQMFPSLRSPKNIMGNNVSATMCPRLPGPIESELKAKNCNKVKTAVHGCNSWLLVRTLSCRCHV